MQLYNQVNLSIPFILHGWTDIANNLGFTVFFYCILPLYPILNPSVLPCNLLHPSVSLYPPVFLFLYPRLSMYPSLRISCIPKSTVFPVPPESPVSPCIPLYPLYLPVSPCIPVNLLYLLYFLYPPVFPCIPLYSPVPPYTWICPKDFCFLSGSKPTPLVSNSSYLDRKIDW